MEENQQSTRWWPLVLIWSLAIVAWIAIGLMGGDNRQIVIMKILATGILGVGLTVVWLLALSRMPWGVRIKVFGVAVLLIKM